LHLPPETRGLVVDRADVLPPYNAAFCYVALQVNPVREPDWEPAACQRCGCGHELAVYGIAAFAIELVAGLQISLCYRNDVAAEPGRRSRGLAAQTDACNRNPEFQPDQMIGLV